MVKSATSLLKWLSLLERGEIWMLTVFCAVPQVHHIQMVTLVSPQGPLGPFPKSTEILKNSLMVLELMFKSSHNTKAKALERLTYPECWKRHHLKHSADGWVCACLFRDSHQELSLQCSLIIMGAKCCIACVTMGMDSFCYSMGLS